MWCRVTFLTIPHHYIRWFMGHSCRQTGCVSQPSLFSSLIALYTWVLPKCLVDLLVLVWLCLLVEPPICVHPLIAMNLRVLESQEKLRPLRHLLVVHMAQNPATWPGELGSLGTLDAEKWGQLQSSDSETQFGFRPLRLSGVRASARALHKIWNNM